MSGVRVQRRYDKRKWFIGLAVFVAVFLFTFLSQLLRGEDVEVLAASLDNFDPGYIISDYQMSNYKSMTEKEIQAFLTSKNACTNTNYDDYVWLTKNRPNYKWHFENGHFVCLSEELFGDGEVIGKGETAAHIIWQAAQDYKINPQVLIVLLQKETGLITDKIPNDKDYRKATGYGCPDTAECSSKYYGFKNQIRNAAAMFRVVLDGGWTNYPLGENYVQYNPSKACGGSKVNIRSLATSALYRYTPYQPNESALKAGYGTGDACGAYGNRNFYLYFMDWFGEITVSKSISAPRNITAEVKDGDSIVVKWDAPSDADLYGEIKYEIVIADANKKETRAEVMGDVREYVFANLDAGNYIAASVKAIAKTGATYDRIAFNLAVGKVPGKPTNVAAEKYNGGIKVSWKEPKENGGLKIEKYEVVLIDADKNEIKQEVTSDKRMVIFYGLAMNEYVAASVKAINVKGGQSEKITFSIKTYGDFPETELYKGFSDMPTDSISKTAVSWAALNGITDKNNNFDGEKALTRRQAMVLLYRIYSSFIK